MLRSSLAAVAAASALILAGPALSRPPNDASGGIWAKSKKPRPKARTQQPRADSAREEARENSQGPANASDTGVANADDNSVLSTNAGSLGATNEGAANANLGAVGNASANSALAAGAVAATALPGLTTGLHVKTGAGASLGTVSEVVTASDGTIRLVVVAGADGKTYRLMPNTLSVSGGIVTTTETNLGG